MNEEEKHQLIISLTKFYMLYRKELADWVICSRLSLSPVLYMALYEVYINKNITTSSLSRKLSITIPNTSRCLCTLESLGYIVKAKDEEDHRKTHIILSEEGRKLVEGTLNEMAETMVLKLRSLKPEELLKLSQAASALIDMFEKLDGEV